MVTKSHWEGSVKLAETVVQGLHLLVKLHIVEELQLRSEFAQLVDSVTLGTANSTIFKPLSGN